MELVRRSERASSWHDGELLGFDLETTGIDPFSDVPVSFALVVARGGTVVATDAALVDPGQPIPRAASAVHGITTARARAEGLPLGRAVVHVAARLIDASRRGVPVVGMKVDYDLTMLDRCYERETGRRLRDDGFRGPVVDALVLDRHLDRYRPGKRTLTDLCRVYCVGLDHAHDAAADAIATVEVVRTMCRRYPALGDGDAAGLHADQRRWHREWMTSFSAWRRRKGLPALPAREEWPIAKSGPRGARNLALGAPRPGRESLDEPSRAAG